MSRERPTSNPDHAEYRSKIIEADNAAARLVEGLRNDEPWAIHLAAVLERLHQSGQGAPHNDGEDHG